MVSLGLRVNLIDSQPQPQNVHIDYPVITMTDYNPDKYGWLVLLLYVVWLPWLVCSLNINFVNKQPYHADKSRPRKQIYNRIEPEKTLTID